jgi:hypothetical protein
VHVCPSGAGSPTTSIAKSRALMRIGLGVRVALSSERRQRNERGDWSIAALE